VTPRGKGCVAASYVCLLLTSKGYTVYMENASFGILWHHSIACIWFWHFVSPRYATKNALTPLGELTGLPQARSWWGGGLLPHPQEPYPLSALLASPCETPDSGSHTPWGKFLDKSLCASLFDGTFGSGRNLLQRYYSGLHPLYYLCLVDESWTARRAVVRWRQPTTWTVPVELTR